MITVNLYYKGQNGNARAFAREMEQSGIADAESDRDLWNRLRPFYEQIISGTDENILIVSHGCLLGFLQAMLMGFEFDDLRKAGFSGRSGSVSGFTIGPNGRTTADYINFRLDI